MRRAESHNKHFERNTTSSRSRRSPCGLCRFGFHCDYGRFHFPTWGVAIQFRHAFMVASALAPMMFCVVADSERDGAMRKRCKSKGRGRRHSPNQKRPSSCLLGFLMAFYSFPLRTSGVCICRCVCTSAKRCISNTLLMCMAGSWDRWAGQGQGRSRLWLWLLVFCCWPLI